MNAVIGRPGGGAASCYGREIKSREGEDELFVENLVCSGVCERYRGPGIMWTRCSACLGSQRRE